MLRAALAVLLAAPLPAAAPAAAPNPVVAENRLPGTPEAQWKVDPGNPGLQGYTTQASVNHGQTVTFKIAAAMPYLIDVLRLGWYHGDGARQVATLPGRQQAQPPCTSQPETGLVDCGNWAASATWRVPARAVSGVYLAHLKPDNGPGSYIPFVVRDDQRRTDIVVQTSDQTWQAYNRYGGNSLYTCSHDCPAGQPHGYKGASKVSYNRPSTVAGQDNLFSAEYPMIRFLEEAGYDAAYLTGWDVAARPQQVRAHRVYVSSGHDEYWSREQRENVWAARDAGVNLAFFSGNEVFWKTRFENGGRTLVCYKDTHFDQRVDPVEWTGTWRDPRFRPPAEVVAENVLTGQLFAVNSGTTAITVPAAYRDRPIWRHTSVAQLRDGETATLAAGTLGYEWDVDGPTAPGGGPNPPGLTWLSETVYTDAEVFVDYGSTVAPHHTAVHHLSLYRAPSGALVFGAGTVQWSWGLASDRTMRQATINLMADMGVTAGTLPADLAVP